MKILQVIPYFYPAYAFGGPAKVAYQISKELAKRGNEVVVYTSDAKDFNSRLNSFSKNIVDGIRVHYFRNLAMPLVKEHKLFLTPQMISRAISEVGRFDVIHLHEYTTFQNVIVAHYAREHNVPYVMQVHGSLSKDGGKRTLKRLYDFLFGYRLLNDASKVVALTRAEAQQYKHMGVPIEKTAIIPNGIDLSEFSVLPPRGTFKMKFEVAHNRKVILYLGRIHKTKGIDFLAKTYAYLIRNMKYEDIVLLIAGPDDGYLSELRCLLRSLKVDDRIVFTGMLSEKEKLQCYVDSDLVVNMEPRNVFGLVPLEAAACSKPVIVSTGNAISEVVRDGGFGFSIKYGDVVSMTSTIHEILNNQELICKLGKNGREYVFRNFSLSKMIERLEQLYKDATEWEY